MALDPRIEAAAAGARAAMEYARAHQDDDEVMAAARAEARRKIERAAAEADDPANWAMARRSGLPIDRPPAAPGAHNIGTVALVEPGVTVYSRTRSRGGTDDLTGALVDPIGGVVIEVIAKGDAETGEVLHRAFRIRGLSGADRLREWVLDESDVNVDSVETTYGASVVKLIRAMAAEVGRKKGNLFDSADKQLVADMFKLAGVVS